MGIKPWRCWLLPARFLRPALYTPLAGLLLAGTAHAGWPTAPGSDTVTYSFDGRTREVRVHLPSGWSAADGIARPLVVALHGGLGNGSNFESNTGYSNKADAENFIVVYPTGVGVLGGTWNASTNCCGTANSQGVNDVAFLRDLVAQVSSHYLIDAQKVFATGHSNGAVMSWRLACDASDIFSAIGPNAGDSTALHADASPCDLQGRQVRVINIHGDADTNMPYDGGESTGLEDYVRQPVETPFTPSSPYYASVGDETDLGLWTGLNGCAFSALATETTSVYVKKTFCSAIPGALQVINYKVVGGDHSWYSGTVSSTDLTWAFFGATGSPTVLFEDGFESGTFSSGGWSTSGSPLVSSGAAYAGSYGARLRANSTLQRLQSTVGYTSVSLEYARRTSGLDAGETLTASWSPDGTTWNVVESTPATSWGVISVTLPAGAAGQSGFRVRFVTNASLTTERGDVDAVRITGN